MTSLLVLFGPDSSIGVGHPDGQLLGAFNEGLAVLGGDSLGTLMAGEGLCGLLDYLGVGDRCDSHRLIS